MLYVSTTNDNHWTKKLKNILENSEKIWKFMDFINFLLFLKEGQYRSFLERVLNMKMVLSSNF